MYIYVYICNSTLHVLIGIHSIPGWRDGVPIKTRKRKKTDSK